MVMVKLEKTFAANKTERTKEESDQVNVPPGKIIGWFIISPSGAAGNVFWWIELGPTKVLPFISTPGHHYLSTDVMSDFVPDIHPAWKSPRVGKLVGWNQHAANTYRIQVGIVIEPEE